VIHDPRPLTAPLKVLGDPTRLRILGLVELEELSVGELGRCLEMAQSRVSNHLRVLREERFLRERHVGPSTYLRLAVEDEPEGAGARELPDLKARLWSALRAELARLPEREADLARLADVVAERRARDRDFFERLAGRWDKIGVDFKTGRARERAAANLLPAGLVLADLGCGTGYLARSLVGLAARLILVDGSAAMLAEARRKLEPLPASTAVELRQGELDRLPIADGELDGLVCGMVLHHLPDLARPFAEMRRVLRPGGAASLLELAPHRETWMHEALGDRHLGLDPRDVCAALERAGFADVRLEAVDDRYEPLRPDAAGENGDAGAREAADGGRAPRASLPLYVVRARVPGEPSSTPDPGT
jgi:ubiquinone/menaquinone biosynthesis C-methylase UbiE/DNA-binding HxlR family transcriptional regulator